MTEADIVHGSLLKWKSWLKWSNKEFRLTNERLYYTADTAQQRECSYAAHSLRVRSGRGNYFDILIGKDSILYLKAQSGSEKAKWVTAIENIKGSIIYKGFIRKWANYIKGWQHRYFVLYNNRLCYFANDHPSQCKKGTKYLDGSSQIRLKWSSAKNGFDIVINEGNVWYIKAASPEEAKCWINRIKDISGPSCVDDTATSTEQGLNDAEVGTIRSASNPGNPINPGNSKVNEVNENSDEDTNFRRDLDCLICLEVLVEPTTLGCGHTFCRNCLSDMWGNNRNNFTCPTCRQGIEIMPQINVALKNLIQTLYTDDDVTTERVHGQYREAFENYWTNRRTLNTQANTVNNSSPFNGNIMEYEFLKRGVWFVFAVWVTAKLFSVFVLENNPIIESKQDVVAPPNNTNILETRSFTMFVLLGMLTCPRFMWIYIATACYSSSFQDIAKIVASLYDQAPGLMFKGKLLFWGCVLPSLWGVPLFYQLQYYLTCFLSAVVTFVDAWSISLEAQYLYLNRENTSFIAGIFRVKFLNSSMCLLFCRFISFLPWNWVPDIIYNCLLLCVGVLFISRDIVRVKGLSERSQHFRIFD